MAEVHILYTDSTYSTDFTDCISLVFGCIHCIHFSLTRPQLGNSGLRETVEFPTRNNDFVVAFKCVQLVNTMYLT